MATPATTTRRAPRVPGRWLLLLLVVAVVNLPLVHSTWQRAQVERSGTDVTASVVDSRVEGSGSDARHYLLFRYPDEVDAAGERSWLVRVDEATHDTAVEAGTLEVRVLPEDPSAYAVDGQVRGSTVVVLTVLADLVVLLVALLLWRFRGRLRPELVLAADGDVQRCAPGARLERVNGDLYVVAGEVLEIRDGELVLEVAERRVRVLLGEHHNPVGHQQSAQVLGRLVA